LSAIAFSDWVRQRSCATDPDNDADRLSLADSAGILRCLVWWPFQEILSGFTIYAGWEFETSPTRPGCSIAVHRFHASRSRRVGRLRSLTAAFVPLPKFRLPSKPLAIAPRPPTFLFTS